MPVPLQVRGGPETDGLKAQLLVFLRVLKVSFDFLISETEVARWVQLWAAEVALTQLFHP